MCLKRMHSLIFIDFPDQWSYCIYTVTIWLFSRELIEYNIGFAFLFFSSSFIYRHVVHANPILTLIFHVQTIFVLTGGYTRRNGVRITNATLLLLHSVLSIVHKQRSAHYAVK